MATLIITRYHEALTTSNGIHIPYSFTYADTLSRESAIGLDSGDIGKLSRQLDNNTLWMLISVTPVTWQGIGIGTVESFDVDDIVTASLTISGIDQANYSGTEIYIPVVDELGNIVSL